MSDVRDRNVLDKVIIEDRKLKLIIIDPLPWDCVVREKHAYILQDKINDYLAFITDAQINEIVDKSKYDKIVITVVADYSYSRYCIEYFERSKNFIRQNISICDLEWIHPKTGESENVSYEDGFSDDYVFDAEKIYPRLKFNYAKNPLESIEIMMNNNKFENDEDKKTNNNTPMVRYWDKYIMVFMQDVGSTYAVLSYDNLPQGYTVEQLQEKAFSNLIRDVSYRYEETIESGVYGLLAGGDFEAEALCLNIWSELCEIMNDDLLIAAPTKDMVLFVPASSKKKLRKMLKFAKKIYNNNLSSSPELIFTKEIFRYGRDTQIMEIVDLHI